MSRARDAADVDQSVCCNERAWTMHIVRTLKNVSIHSTDCWLLARKIHFTMMIIYFISSRATKQKVVISSSNIKKNRERLFTLYSSCVRVIQGWILGEVDEGLTTVKQVDCW